MAFTIRLSIIIHYKVNQGDGSLQIQRSDIYLKLSMLKIRLLFTAFQAANVTGFAN